MDEGVLIEASDRVRRNSLVLVCEEYVDRGETPGPVICEGGEFRMEDKDMVEEFERGL